MNYTSSPAYRKVVLDCLRLILHPVVRFCVRKNLTIQDLVEVSKQAFVSVAEDEIQAGGGKINTSRLSVVTGLRRREVLRVQSEESEEGMERASILTRVIGLWLSHEKYLTEEGTPRPLAVGRKEGDFRELVTSVSTDVKPGTVLAELERIGAVTRFDKVAQLQVKAYNPKGNPEESFALLSMDIDDLIVSVERNAFAEDPGETNLHVTTEFDKIPANKIPELKKWVLKQGVAFHETLRERLSKEDVDTSESPDTNDEHCRVVVCSFSHMLHPQSRSSDE